MSNLLTTTDGTNAVIIAQRFLLQRRLARFFKRNLVISYNEWLKGNGFHVSKLLGELNASHDPEILDLYRLLGLVGGLPASIQDVDIYVDPDTGSDDTGDGTESKPYATLWFLPSLPRRIDHTYNILLKEDLTYVGTLMLDFEFGADGYLSFIGVGAPELIEGPFEIAATDTLEGGFGRYFRMTTPFALDYSNEFLMAIDGGSSGQAQAIHSRHAADTVITLADSFNSISVGDNMNVVRPSVTLGVGNLSCNCQNRTGYSDIVRDGGQLSFINLKVQINQGGNVAKDSILINNECSQLMSFVQIIPPNNGSWRVTEKAELNTQSAQVLSASLSDCGVTNINEYSSSQQLAGLACQDTGKSYPLTVEGMARWASNRGIIDITKNGCVQNVSAERFRVTSAVARAISCLVQGRSNAGAGAGIEVLSSTLDISGLIVLNSENAVTILRNSNISLSGAGADAAYSTMSQYGIYFVGVGTVEIRDSGALLTGAVNGVYFATVNPGIAGAIPAVLGFSTDAQLSSLKRLGV